MFIATNRIKVKTGYGETLEHMFKARGAVQDHPGFISFELWKMHKTPDHEDFLVVTHWETEEHHHTWTRSDAFRSAHAGVHRISCSAPASSTPTTWYTAWRLPARRRRLISPRLLRAGVHDDYRSESAHRPGRRARHRLA